MRETWYVLEDGRLADPADISTGDDGRLVNSKGVLVAMRGSVPHSYGVDDPEAERELQAKGEGSQPYVVEGAETDAEPEGEGEDAGDDAGYEDEGEGDDVNEGDEDAPPVKDVEGQTTPPTPPRKTREIAADKPGRGKPKTRGTKKAD